MPAIRKPRKSRKRKNVGKTRKRKNIGKSRKRKRYRRTSIKNKIKGGSLLKTAIEDGDNVAVKKVLNGNPNMVDQDGNTALIIAANLGAFAIVEMLLNNKDVNPNIVNKTGDTALILAIQNRHTNIANQLSNNSKIDPNIANHNNEKPIILAASNNDWSVVVRLLYAGADPNATDHNNNTPLILAAIDGRWQVNKLLLELNADVNLKNNEEKTVIDIMEELENTSTFNSKDYTVIEASPEIVEQLKLDNNKERLGMSGTEILNILRE